MNAGLIHIAVRRLAHYRAAALILAACIGVTLFLPLATVVLARWYSTALVARADATPLVAGGKGNRFDLVLAAMYWRRASTPSLTMAQFQTMRQRHVADDGAAIPLHVRFTAQRVPIIATTPEYFEARRLHARDGTLPQFVGDAVLGAAAARQLRVNAGDNIFSDQIDTFDISKPPSLKMRVTGVLETTGSPDDDVIFVSLHTAWILEGFAHGHADADTRVPERLVQERSDRHIAISEELIEYNEVTSDNLLSFHLHATEDALPLSGVLIFPRDQRSGTLIKSRINVTRDLQAVVARSVIDELLAIVGRVKAILYAFFVVLAVSTASLIALITMLSLKARAREIETFHRLGCSKWFVVQLQTAELVMVFAIGAAPAVVSTLICVQLTPALVRVVQTGVPPAP